MPSKIMRGRREGRVSADTHGPRAKKMHGAGTTGIAGYPGLPCANGFNGFLRALPGDQTLLSPSPARRESVFANLAPALGRQDHTTSPSAAARARPAQLPRPSQPATQRIVTTRTPLCMRRDASREDTVWPRGEAEYFSRYDWTSGIALKRREKFDFWRRRFGAIFATSRNAAGTKPNALCLTGKSPRRRAPTSPSSLRAQAKQSRDRAAGESLDCFVASAPRNDGERPMPSHSSHAPPVPATAAATTHLTRHPMARPARRRRENHAAAVACQARSPLSAARKTSLRPSCW